MPESFLPDGLIFVRLLLQALACCLQVLSGTDHQPAFFPLRQHLPYRHVVAAVIGELLPLLRFLGQGRLGLRTRFRDPTAPADLGLIVGFHIGLTVASTVKDPKAPLARQARFPAGARAPAERWC